jgi:hypothetical protein
MCSLRAPATGLAHQLGMQLVDAPSGGLRTGPINPETVQATAQRRLHERQMTRLMTVTLRASRDHIPDDITVARNKTVRVTPTPILERRDRATLATYHLPDGTLKSAGSWRIRVFLDCGP